MKRGDGRQNKVQGPSIETPTGALCYEGGAETGRLGGRTPGTVFLPFLFFLRGQIGQYICMMGRMNEGSV